MKKYILILLIIPISVLSQDILKKDSIYQNVIFNVIQLVNEYETTSRFNSESNRERFRDLFESSNTKIANDIPIFSEYDKKISIDEYIKLMRKYYKRMSVSVDMLDIKNINFDEIDKGSLTVLISKEVKGDNVQYEIEYMYDGDKERQGVAYEDNFNLELDVDFYKDSTKITDIRIVGEKGDLLVVSPHWGRLWERSEKQLKPISEIKVNVTRDGVKKTEYIDDFFYSVNDLKKGTKVKFTSLDSRYVGSTKSIGLNDFKNSGEDHVYKLKFRKTIGDAGFFGLLPNVLNDRVKLVSSDNYFYSPEVLSDNYTMTNSYGVGFRYNLDDLFKKNWDSDKRSNSRFSLFTGGGYVKDHYNYDLYIPNFSDDFRNANGERQLFTDMDGAQYKRHVMITDFNENQRFNMEKYFISLGGRGEFSPKMLSNFDGELQLMFHLPLKTKILSNEIKYTNSATALYSGEYNEDLYNITISENGVYDYGSFAINDSGILQASQEIQSFLLEAGLVLTFNEFIVVDVGIFYTGYSGDIILEPNDDYLSFDSDELNSMENLIDLDFNSLALKLGFSIKL